MTDITRYDAVTGEVTFEAFTAADRAIVDSLAVGGQAEMNALELEEQQKIAIKEEAIAALAALGLTEAQAKAIAGV